MRVTLKMMGKSYLYLALTILLWGATPLIVSRLSLYLPVFEINWIVTAFSIILLSPLVLLSERSKVLGSYKRKDYITMLVMGAIGIFPYTTLYYLAFSFAPANAGNINIINYTWPIWIIILSLPLLKESLNWKKLLGIFLGFAGTYIIVSGGNVSGGNGGNIEKIGFFHTSNYVYAYLSAGAGAFFWGLFSVLSKRYHFEPLSSLLIYNISAFLCFTIIAFLFTPLIIPSLYNWILLFILGGFINGLGYLFWILALKHGDTSRIANLVYLTPFIALVYLYVFRGTKIHAFQFTGLTLIVAGPLVQYLLRKKNLKHP